MISSICGTLNNRHGISPVSVVNAISSVNGKKLRGKPVSVSVLRSIMSIPGGGGRRLFRVIQSGIRPVFLTIEI